MRRYRDHFRRLALIVITLVVSISGGLGVHAYADSTCPTGMSKLDCDALYGDWVNWVPDDGSCSANLSSVSLLGSDNIEQAYNYFVQQGLSAASAAGIIGNLMVESGVDPTRLQGQFSHETPSATLTRAQLDNSQLGWGIAQWTPSSKIITASITNGVSTATIDTLGFQVEFLFKQLNSNPSYYELPQLKAVPDTAAGAGSAAAVFEAGYERALNGGDVGLRSKNAAEVWTKYHSNGTSSSGVTTAAQSDGTCGSAKGSASLDGFTVYNQCNPTWGSTAYGTSTICASGCGPTSMAMIVSTLTGTPVTPVQMSSWYASNGYYIAHQGTSWAGAPAAAKKYGLNAVPISNDVAKISAALQSGGFVIIAGTGGLPFTSAGHFIVLRGITTGGKWLVADPYGVGTHINDNTKEWDPQALIAAGAENGSGYVITK